MKIGSTYKTNSSGIVEVVSYKNNNEVLVRFIDTGYETTTQKIHIVNGRVKDKMLPTIYGVAFMGDGEFKTSENGKVTKCYSIWKAMIQRCYRVESRSYKSYGGSGVTVCDEWLNYQNFAEWFHINYREGLHLDKDIKIDGNKIYSPISCKFVTPAENTEKASAKKFRMKSPEGSLVEIYNMSKFCKENGLCNKNMCAVHSGKIKRYKSWEAWD